MEKLVQKQVEELVAFATAYGGVDRIVGADALIAELRAENRKLCIERDETRRAYINLRNEIRFDRFWG